MLEDLLESIRDNGYVIISTDAPDDMNGEGDVWYQWTYVQVRTPGGCLVRYKARHTMIRGAR